MIGALGMWVWNSSVPRSSRAAVPLASSTRRLRRPRSISSPWPEAWEPPAAGLHRGGRIPTTVAASPAPILTRSRPPSSHDPSRARAEEARGTRTL